MEIGGYKVSKHLTEYLKVQRSNIKPEWISEAVRSPDYTLKISEREVRIWKRIPEFGNRFLRVVVNPEDRVIVTAFFDRRFKL